MFCAALLATVVLQDIWAVFVKVKIKGSSVEFLEVPNGAHQKSILMFNTHNITDTRESKEVKFWSFCSCALMSFTNRSRFDVCSEFWETDLDNSLVTFVANPSDFSDRNVHL